jgi:hypothetical protein
MHVPEIIEVKDHLEELKSKSVIKSWEIPYENILTRRSAAIFFFTPVNETDSMLDKISTELEKYDNFSYRINHEKKLSDLAYRLTFSKEEKENNLAGATAK